MSFSFRMFLSNKNIQLNPGQSKYCLNDLMVLYMSFDMFLLAVESRDLSQTDKIFIIGSFFGQAELFGKHFFLKKLLFTQAQTFCKINPHNPLRSTSHQKN